MPEDAAKPSACAAAAPRHSMSVREALGAKAEDVLSRIARGENVKVPALAPVIGISRGGLYQAIERKEVAAVAIGRALFVPAYEARRLLGMPALEAA